MSSENITPLLSFLFGSLATWLSSFLSNRQRNKYEKEILTIKNNSNNEKEYKDHLRHNIEKAFRLVKKISYEFSVTKNYILWSTEVGLVEFHKRYDDIQEDLIELNLCANLYIHDIVESTNILSDYANVIWGYQHRLLKYTSDEVLSQQDLLNEITQKADKLQGEAFKIQQALVKKGANFGYSQLLL